MLLKSNETTYHQMAMTAKVGRYRSLRSVSVEVAIYLAILLTAPFAHHDLDCHLKTPLHCPACASSQVGLNTPVPAIARTVNLPDAGDVITCQPSAIGTLLPVRSTGRSPPSHV
jgi:hypothetical protein